MERARQDPKKAEPVALASALACDAVTADIEGFRAGGSPSGLCIQSAGGSSPAATRMKERALPACIRLTPTRSTGSVTFARRPEVLCLRPCSERVGAAWPRHRFRVHTLCSRRNPSVDGVLDRRRVAGRIVLNHRWITHTPIPARDAPIAAARQLLAFEATNKRFGKDACQPENDPFCIVLRCVVSSPAGRWAHPLSLSASRLCSSMAVLRGRQQAQGVRCRPAHGM